MFFGLFLVLFGLFFVLVYNVHYIVLLLLFELMLMGVLLLIFFDFLSVSGLVGSFIFLLLMVCMGGYSISLLVCTSRFFGRDFWFFNFIF